MANEYLLILGGEQAQRERALVGAIRSSEHKMIACMSTAKVIKYNKYFDLMVPGNETSPDNALHSIVMFENKTSLKPCAVIPMNKEVLESGQAIANHYKLPFLSLETIKTCENLVLTADLLDEASIPHDLSNKGMDLARVSVEVLNHQHGRAVLGVTDKLFGAEKPQQDIGHIVPSRYILEKEISNMALRCCEVFNIEYGIAHIDFRLSDGGFKVSEVSCEPSAFGAIDSYEASYGYNPYSLHIQSYLHRIRHSDLSLSQQAASSNGMAFIVPNPGRVIEVNRAIIPSIAQHFPSIERIHITVKEGDIISQDLMFSGKYGHIEYRQLDPSIDILELSRRISQKVILTKP